MNHSALFVTTVPITLEAFLVPFARHFRELGWRVDAMANGATTHPHIDGEFDNLLDVGWSRNPLDPRNLVGSAGKVRAVVKQGGYDIVHVHTPIAAFVTRYALRALQGADRPVVIYTAHGFHFFEGQSPARNAVYRSLERRAAIWTDYLVTINAEDFSAAQDFGTIDPDRVHLIPGIGVDTDLFTPRAGGNASAQRDSIRAEFAVPADAFVIAMVAEFAPVKQHALVFEALARVRDPRATLVLVGEGPLESALRDKAVALGLTSRLRWAGYRRDVPAVLGASDALMLVSEREGLARSVLEGMAAGLPVIGTDTRGITDAVGADAGWVVPNGDVDSLAAAIDEAASHPEEAARRGANARRRVETEFSLARIIAEYEELYREALASRL